jgi:hypothetical protein
MRNVSTCTDLLFRLSQLRTFLVPGEQSVSLSREEYQRWKEKVRVAQQRIVDHVCVPLLRSLFAQPADPSTISTMRSDLSSVQSVGASPTPNNSSETSSDGKEQAAG